MHNLAVMYHYVSDRSTMKGMSVDAFRRQLLHLKERYEIMTLSQALDYRGAKKTCVLTFDDGLKDSVETILPVLLESGVKAVFFVSAATIEHRSVLNVQKRHLLLGKIGSSRMVHELNARLPHELRVCADEVFRADYLDDLLTCSMKWMLDFADREIMEPVLAEIFQEHFPDEAALHGQLYLSSADLKTLLSEGMEIGAHGYAHHQLGRLSFAQQEQDIAKTTLALKKVVGEAPLYLSYPLGSYNPLTIRLLEKYGYRAAMTINKHDNDNATSVYQLGRYDCIDLPVE